MGKQTIITCDGCGMKLSPGVSSCAPDKVFHVRVVQPVKATIDGIDAENYNRDVCCDCYKKWHNLNDPKNWPRGEGK